MRKLVSGAKWSALSSRPGVRCLMLVVLAVAVLLSLQPLLWETTAQRFRREMREIRRSPTPTTDCWDWSRKIRMHDYLNRPEEIQLIVAALSEANCEVRGTAAAGLLCFGPNASEAVPAATRCLSDVYPVVRSNAAAALGEILANTQNKVPTASDALRRALTDTSAHVRMAAAGALIRIGDYRGVVEALQDGLRNEEQDVRRFAAYKMAGLRLPAAALSSAVPALIEATHDPSCWTRLHAAETLVAAGESRRALATVFETLPYGYTPWLRYCIFIARSIDPADGPAKRLLIQHVHHESPNIRLVAAAGLLRLREFRSAIPILVDGLKDEDKMIRADVLQALQSLGPDDAAAIPLLAAAWESNDAEGTEALDAVIQNIAPKLPPGELKRIKGEN
jgi:HEAT repeat protein